MLSIPCMWGRLAQKNYNLRSIFSDKNELYFEVFDAFSINFNLFSLDLGETVFCSPDQLTVFFSPPFYPRKNGTYSHEAEAEVYPSLRSCKAEEGLNKERDGRKRNLVENRPADGGISAIGRFYAENRRMS